MEKRNIGSLEVSVTGLGCNNFGWRIDKTATKEVVWAALDAGINFLDTADMYGNGQSEEYLADALAGRRQQVVLATKFGMSMGDGRAGAGKAWIAQACEDSLRRLKTDRIDLYQLHKPDPNTPIGETLEALDELVKAGKVREIGCSNFSAEQLREATAALMQGAPRFVSVQNQYSMFHREPEGEVLPECRKSDIAFIPFFPLANGLLTGKYRKGRELPENSRGKDAWGPKIFSEQNLEAVESLITFAEERGHNLLELAVSWLAVQAGVASVIAGAKTAQQVKMNAVAARWKLTPDDLHDLGELLIP